MFDDLGRELKRLGFTDKESSVYLALLRFGDTGVNDIAQTAGVTRASTYDTLEGLGRMGLVTAYVENEQRRFSVEPPERLLTVLHLQRREVEVREEYAERLLPRLTAFHSSHETKPRIRYIEGIDGLRNMQREYEMHEGDIIQLVGYDAFRALEEKKMSREHRDMLHRTPRRVRTMLVTDGELPPAQSGAELRRVSPSLVQAMGEVTVWGDRVILFSYAGGIIAVEIRSPAIAGTLRAALELAWKATEAMPQ